MNPTTRTLDRSAQQASANRAGLFGRRLDEEIIHRSRFFDAPAKELPVKLRQPLRFLGVELRVRHRSTWALHSRLHFSRAYVASSSARIGTAKSSALAPCATH